MSIGGFNSTSVTGALFAYNPSTNTWATLASMPTPAWMPRGDFGRDGRLFVIGGENSSGAPIDATQIYNSSTNTWTTGPTVGARRQHGAFRDSDGRPLRRGRPGRQRRGDQPGV